MPLSKGLLGKNNRPANLGLSTSGGEIYRRGRTMSFEDCQIIILRRYRKALFNDAAGSSWFRTTGRIDARD